MCAVALSFFHAAGVDPALFHLFNNGDDCFVILDQEYEERVRADLPGWCHSLGFEIVVEPETARCLEECVFCQTQPVFDGRAWRMVRQLPSLAKDALCLLQGLDLKRYLRFYREVGTCGLALCEGMPVMHAFYRFLCSGSTDLVDPRNCESLVGTGMWFLAYGKHAVERVDGFDDVVVPAHNIVVTDAARVSFTAAFGLLPAAQEALEEQYSRMTLAGAKVQADHRASGPSVL